MTTVIGSIRLALVIGAAALLGACGNHAASSNGQAASTTQPSLGSATSPEAVQQAAAAAKAASLPQPDWSTPDSAYVPITKGTQLMFLYSAFSGLPPDYDKMAQAFSNDYASTSDVFKKQTLLTALRPKLDAGITDARQHPYVIWTIGRYDASLSHYEMAQHAFALNANILQQGGSGYMSDASAYNIAFTNGTQFLQLHVTDEATAHAIENIVSGSQSFGGLKIYAFVQSTDDTSSPTVEAMITKVELLGPQGNVLFTQTAKH